MLAKVRGSCMRGAASDHTRSASALCDTHVHDLYQALAKESGAAFINVQASALQSKWCATACL